MAHRAKHDIYLSLTRDRAVPAGSPAAKFLLARAGAEIPDKIAAQHGIIEGSVVNDAEPGATLPDLSTPRNNVAPVADAPRRGRPPKTTPE